ncbi:uncharacterized protein FOMMEDRAFT_18794, partial [Fomitiporia mediterranea MF3/22]|uniref:uncharacterized protein n=1 Tax=Fomitiporia mediterranea (strain MF3/22) TaxID=694068 RepID=UPI0004407453
ALLIQILKKAKDNGLQAESGWKPVVWSLAVKALTSTESESGRVRKEVKYVRSQFYRYKKSFPLYKEMAELVEGIVADRRSAFQPSQNTQTLSMPSLQAASSSSLTSNKTSSVSAVPKSLEDISDFESDTSRDNTQYTETLPTVDEELSDNNMVDVAEMICKHTSIANTYLALQNKDYCTTYLQKSLARYKGM